MGQDSEVVHGENMVPDGKALKMLKCGVQQLLLRWLPLIPWLVTIRQALGTRQDNHYVLNLCYDALLLFLVLGYSFHLYISAKYPPKLVVLHVNDMWQNFCRVRFLLLSVISNLQPAHLKN